MTTHNTKKNILILGSGAREHALAWKMLQSNHVEKVWIAPGNAGIGLEKQIKNAPLDLSNHASVLAFAIENAIDLTLVGPEQPLVEGIVDYFQAHQQVIFGPNKRAAQIEGSKRFCKQLLEKYNIPTAAYCSFSANEYKAACVYLKNAVFPQVLKADGLAAGKGVVIAYSLNEAIATLDDIFLKKQFGDAGNHLVIEDFLEGEEASFMVAACGDHYITMPSSQDHKARDEGDKGPNTGGMGAYSPAPIIENSVIQEKIIHHVIEPTLRAFQKEGIHFCGFLYAGLMIHEGNVSVLEYNCRLGDPETQVIMMRLISDFYEFIDAVIHKKTTTPKWSKEHALTVVMATKGYPVSYPKNTKIDGLPMCKAGEKIFIAGVQLSDDGGLETVGGRVLSVSALGSTLKDAQSKAYDLLDQVQWKDGFCRRDIGYKGVV